MIALFIIYCFLIYGPGLLLLIGFTSVVVDIIKGPIEVVEVEDYPPEDW